MDACRSALSADTDRKAAVPLPQNAGVVHRRTCRVADDSDADRSEGLTENPETRLALPENSPPGSGMRAKDPDPVVVDVVVVDPPHCNGARSGRRRGDHTLNGHRARPGRRVLGNQRGTGIVDSWHRMKR